MKDGNDTTHAPNGFVRASELYCIDTRTIYPHPDKQATDKQIEKIFDLTGGNR